MRFFLFLFLIFSTTSFAQKNTYCQAVVEKNHNRIIELLLEKSITLARLEIANIVFQKCLQKKHSLKYCNIKKQSILKQPYQKSNNVRRITKNGILKNTKHSFHATLCYRKTTTKRGDSCSDFFSTKNAATISHLYTPFQNETFFIQKSRLLGHFLTLEIKPQKTPLLKTAHLHISLIRGHLPFLKIIQKHLDQTISSANSSPVLFNRILCEE